MRVESLDALHPVGGECGLFPRPALDLQAADEVNIDALPERTLGRTETDRDLAAISFAS